MVSEPSLLTDCEGRMTDSDLQAVSHSEMRELLESLSPTFDKRCAEMSAFMKRQVEDVVGRVEQLSFGVSSPRNVSGLESSEQEVPRIGSGIQRNQVKLIRIELGTFSGGSDPLEWLT